MNTNTQPSEHAMRAAEQLDGNLYISEQARKAGLNKLAGYIDQHAIAPAVAEATIKHESVVIDLLCQLAEQDAEIARLKANIGCARDQRSTQFCAEVVQRDKRIAELEAALQAIAGTTMSKVASMEHGFYRCTGIAAAVLKPKKGQP